MKKKRIFIVGGGISGLSFAYRITEMAREAKLPLEIKLLEASDRLGGVIRTRQEGPFLMESGPDAFITEKPEALALCRRLGIQEELINTNEQERRSFIYRNGRLHQVPEGFYLMTPSRIRPFISSSIISKAGKARMLLEPLVSRLRNRNDESVGGFVRRRFGVEALEAIAQPMIAGIYMADPYQLSLKATFPKFLELEAKYGTVLGGILWKRRRIRDSDKASGPRYSLFTTLRRGMGSLVQHLVSSLPEVDFLLNARISRLERSDGWKATLNTGEVLEADILCLATPTYIAGRLMESIDPPLSEELKGIRYESVVTVNLVFRREKIDHPLNGFGFVVPNNQKRKIIACSFPSIKFEGRAPGGYVLLRAFLGGVFQPSINHLSDEMIEQTAIEELSDILSIHDAPEQVSISRHDLAMPQYAVGHLDRIERIEQKEEALQDLYLVGNGYRGMGVPDCIRYAEAKAEKLIKTVPGTTGTVSKLRNSEAVPVVPGTEVT